MNIPFEDFVEYALDSLGSQIHINHENCTAGKDTKKRLYIRRLDNGNILAYCHNCSKSGHFVEAFSRTRAASKRSYGSIRESESISFSLPKDYEGDIGTFPASAKTWLYKYGIRNDQIKQYGIGYSEYHKRVVLPIWRDGELRKYQMRKIFEQDIGPKYITFRKNHEVKEGFVATGKMLPETLVIVEDVLSAIRVAEQFNSLALMSDSISDYDLIWICQHFSKVLIWLDNDNRQVQLSQIRIKNKLDNLVKSVKIIREEKEPKHFSDIDIKRIVYAANEI